MILDPSNLSYSNLPGIWTLLGGLWVLHFSYWGFNQYIIQRASVPRVWLCRMDWLLPPF